jgi:hypothetical protein
MSSGSVPTSSQKAHAVVLLASSFLDPCLVMLPTAKKNSPYLHHMMLLLG